MSAVCSSVLRAPSGRARLRGTARGPRPPTAPKPSNAWTRNRPDPTRASRLKTPTTAPAESVPARTHAAPRSDGHHPSPNPGRGRAKAANAYIQTDEPCRAPKAGGAHPQTEAEEGRGGE